MDAWRNDPVWTNACRILFAAGLAVVAFVHPLPVSVEVVATAAWFGSALVLLWWRYKKRQAESRTDV